MSDKGIISKLKERIKEMENIIEYYENIIRYYEYYIDSAHENSRTTKPLWVKLPNWENPKIFPLRSHKREKSNKEELF